MLHSYDYHSFLSELLKSPKNDNKKIEAFNKYLNFIQNSEFDVNQIFVVNKRKLHILNVILKSQNEHIIEHFFKKYKKDLHIIDSSCYLNILLGLVHLEKIDMFKHFYSKSEEHYFETKHDTLNKSFKKIDDKVVYFGYPDFINLNNAYYSVYSEEYFFQCLFKKSLLNKSKDLCLFLLKQPNKKLGTYFSKAKALCVSEWFFEEEILTLLDKLTLNNVRMFNGKKQRSYFQLLCENEKFYYNYLKLGFITLRQKDCSNKNLIEQITYIYETFKDKSIVLHFIENNIITRYHGSPGSNSWSEQDLDLLAKSIQPFFTTLEDLSLFVCPEWVKDSQHIWSDSLFSNNDKLYEKLITDIKNSSSAISEANKNYGSLLPAITINDRAIANFCSVDRIYPGKFQPSQFSINIENTCQYFSNLKNIEIEDKNNIFQYFTKKDYQKVHDCFISNFVQHYYERKQAYSFYETMKLTVPYLFDNNTIKETILNEDKDHISILREILILKSIIPVSAIQIHNNLQSGIDFIIQHSTIINKNIIPYLHDIQQSFRDNFDSSNSNNEDEDALLHKLQMCHDQIQATWELSVLSINNFDSEENKKIQRI